MSYYFDMINKLEDAIKVEASMENLEDISEPLVSHQIRFNFPSDYSGFMTTTKSILIHKIIY